MTNRELRTKLMRREGVDKVVIGRDGVVTLHGHMPRGDGGKTPWSQYAGWADELKRYEA